MVSASLDPHAVRVAVANWRRDRAEREARPAIVDARVNEARLANLKKALEKKYEGKALEELREKLHAAEAREAKLALHNQQLRAAVSLWGRGYGWLLMDPEEQKRRRR
jgi:hypothetical protein